MEFLWVLSREQIYRFARNEASTKERERTVHVTRDTLCSIALLPFRLFVFCSVLGVVCPSTTEYISRAEPFHSE
jgi:hypothetical protein